MFPRFLRSTSRSESPDAVQVLASPPLPSLALGTLLGAGTTFFLILVDHHYAISEWLLWLYLKCWLLAGVFVVASLVSGHALLVRLLGRTLGFAEHAVFSFGLGAFAFFWAVLACALLGFLNAWTFFLVPALLVATGGRDAWSTLRRLRRRSTLWTFRGDRRTTLWQTLSWSVGLLALGAIYFQILTPNNVCYDSRWYHIPLAEHYVAAGRIVRFDEGWFLGTYPHLASFYFAWALLWPAASFFQRIELIAHLEFVFFLFTLAGIPLLVRRLLPTALRNKSRGTSAFVWLFFGVFSYDSSLHAGADHFASVWVAPLFLVFLRSVEGKDRRYVALLALFAAAILNTKISAVIAVAFPVLAFAIVEFVAIFRERAAGGRLVGLRGLLFALVLGLALTTPFWLKNWVYYGNPVYPKLTTIFGGFPRTPDYQIPLERWFYPPYYHASADLKGLWFSLGAQVQFSFTPYDWNQRPFPAPSFGSAYTLLLAAVPFLGKRRRLWALVAAIQVALFVWVQIHHFERYLQTILPWMAAVTAAVSILVWHKQRWLRVPLVALLASQVAWGSDAYFKTHAMAGSAIKSTIDLIAAGRAKNRDARFRVPQSWDSVSEGTNASAKFLVHETHVHWGLERASVSDWQGSQGGISYVRDRNLKGVDERLRSLGVTHLVWTSGTSQGYDTLGSDLLFFDYAERLAVRRRTRDGKQVAELPPSGPETESHDPRALLLTCGTTYPPGIHRLARLTHSDLDPKKKYPRPVVPLANPAPTEAELSALLQQVEYLVLEHACTEVSLSPALRRTTRKLAQRPGLTLFRRAPGNGS